jgi:hypothetical protein
MCRAVSNFSQKRNILKKLEILLPEILKCFYFSKSTDKSSNQTFPSRISFEIIMLDLKSVGFIFLAIINHNRIKKILSKEFFISTSCLVLVCF